MTRKAAAADADNATAEYDDARAWLSAQPISSAPFYAEVYVINIERSHVLLVRHRIRGWVPPGGTVEVGETPRQAAVRELREETGVLATLMPAPIAVAVRSFRIDWEPTLSLTYGAFVDLNAPLHPESAQPARWVPLDARWQSVFPEDFERIRLHVDRSRPPAV